MKERDRRRAEELDTALRTYAAERQPLAGIANPERRAVFVQQLIDSTHRILYPRLLLGRPMSARRVDPNDEEFFDPIRAAVYESARGNHDEACWLVFLFVTYGKGARTGWRLIRDVYRRLGEGGRWDWRTASANPEGMAEWIAAHSEALSPPGSPRAFGAHRQYEAVTSSGGTVATYLRWIGPDGHRAKFDAAAAVSGGDRRRTFDVLYREMDVVYRYGRLAKFDYLAMLGKLELAAVEPGSTYMTGATGPVTGARLLFANDPKARLRPRWLDAQLADLDSYLGVGMQALEDALCNWQKSPELFRPFRG